MLFPPTMSGFSLDVIISLHAITAIIFSVSAHLLMSGDLGFCLLTVFICHRKPYNISQSLKVSQFKTLNYNSQLIRIVLQCVP